MTLIRHTPRAVLRAIAVLTLILGATLSLTNTPMPLAGATTVALIGWLLVTGFCEYRGKATYRADVDQIVTGFANLSLAVVLPLVAVTVINYGMVRFLELSDMIRFTAWLNGFVQAIAAMVCLVCVTFQTEAVRQIRHTGGTQAD